MGYPVAYRRGSSSATSAGTRPGGRLSSSPGGSGGGFRPPANDNRPWPKLRPANDNNKRLARVARNTALRTALAQGLVDTAKQAMLPYRVWKAAKKYQEGLVLVEEFVDSILPTSYRAKPQFMWNGWNGTVCPRGLTLFSTSGTLSCGYVNSVIGPQTGPWYRGSGQWIYSRAWNKSYRYVWANGQLQFFREYRLKWEFSKWVTNPNPGPAEFPFWFPSELPIPSPSPAPQPSPQPQPETWPEFQPRPMPRPIAPPYPLIPHLPSHQWPQGREVGNEAPNRMPETEGHPYPDPSPQPETNPNPEPPNREVKRQRKSWGNSWTGRAWGAVNLWFEGNEWVDIAYASLDKKAKRSCGRAWNVAQKAACVAMNWNSIDEETLFRNIVKNQIEDFIIGLQGRAMKAGGQARYGPTDHWAFKEIERQMKKKYGDDYTNLPTRDISREAQKWADKVIDAMKEGIL